MSVQGCRGKPSVSRTGGTEQQQTCHTKHWSPRNTVPRKWSPGYYSAMAGGRTALWLPALGPPLENSRSKPGPALVLWMGCQVDLGSWGPEPT